ncbi:MAG: 16S rRNA (guanine(527)-N(7))-methyltransferase RsmG [Clostridia bacterium]|nr:16S rRNA (guanine(527)-N(7))-methyltransferase RsmG [Clostridia bacterium]
MSSFNEWNYDNIIEIFKSQKIELTIDQAQKLCVFGEFLQQKNQEINLTAIVDTNEVIVKHFLDSALIVPFIPTNANLCDVGCGAGFPSVVAKILRPDITITAVDSVGKKIAFVTELLAKIQVDGQTKNLRAEDLAKTNREYYDVVTARAVANLTTLLEYLAPLVRLGGLVIAQKGKDGVSEAKDADFCAKTMGLTLVNSLLTHLPNGDQRMILVYKKVNSTPKKYPRPKNAPKKNPLTNG